MSEITLNIKLNGSNYNELQTFYSIMIAYDEHQCAIMAEMTLNITLHGSNCNRLLRNFIL